MTVMLKQFGFVGMLKPWQANRPGTRACSGKLSQTLTEDIFAIRNVALSSKLVVKNLRTQMREDHQKAH